MRIAVIGAGITGLASSWLLSRRHQITLFEANDYLGGHTHTHQIRLAGREYAVDSGFIVFSPRQYPLFTAMLAQLRVETQPTTMSFSVRNEASGLEYNATRLDTLFCQRRNLVSPRFLGMVRDLLRFYREAPALLTCAPPGPTLAEYLSAGRYGDAFRDDHLVPMASALWSSPPAQILSFPARYLVQFMANHQMLTVSDRPQWRVVRGGSASYVRALRARWTVEERPACPVRAIHRDNDAVVVAHAGGTERFDQVVLACHSDQALGLLTEPSAAERAILGAIGYQPNEAVLHTDPALLPRQRKAWAAWNAYVPSDSGAPCTVSYCMNLLQSLDSAEPLIVTLNRTAAIDPTRILRVMRYAHPVHTHAAVAAQRRRDEIQGVNRTWFAGAYWGWGFHEDGMRSAVEVATRLDAHCAQPLTLGRAAA
jgi:predicted NAD/FAD-binding protein